MPRLFNVHQLSNNEIYDIKMSRWRARTDLGYLCREILGWPDVSDDVHGGMMNVLQKFPVPTNDQFWLNDDISKGFVKYTPITPMMDLPGKRRALILDSRGFLKTTINAKGHTIQWLLNYPDMAAMIMQSTIGKAEDVLLGIKKQFINNITFRQLFPEHVPDANKVRDWGTKSYFTTEARSKFSTREFPSVMVGSIDKQMAGIHVDLIKCSDIVEPDNVATEELRQLVIDNYYMSENLLVGPNFWIDIEGTRYHFGELYGKLIRDEWVNTPPEERRFKMYVRGCYKKKTPDGKPQLYTPEELDYPDLVNEKGEFVPTWHHEGKGFTFKEFEAKRRAAPFIFSCQQLNNPDAAAGGDRPFPINEKTPVMIDEQKFRQNVRISHYIASVDSAQALTKRANFSCISVAAVGADGRRYVVDIRHGKWLPSQLVDQIFDVADKYLFNKGETGPRLKTINIEKTAYTEGLSLGIQMRCQLQRKFLPIEMIPRDNQTKKTDRIKNTLQEPYNNGRLRFLSYLNDIKRCPSGEAGMSIMQYLKQELKEFPLGTTDDMLDTLADLFQNADWVGREFGRPSNFVQQQQDEWAKFLGTESVFDEEGQLTPAYWSSIGIKPG